MNASDNDKVTPTLSRPRRSPEQPQPKVPGQRAAQHIPTAAPAPVTLTAEKLQREIEAARLHEPYLVGYGGLQAHAAFGGAA